MATFTSFPKPTADMASKAFGQAAALATAQYESAMRNTDNQFIYDSAIRDYNLNMANGSKNPDLHVPEAPLKWVVEPGQGEDGYAAAVQSTTERLTSAIPISTFNAAVPVVYPPGHASIGHQIGDSAFWTTMPDDTIPGGELVMWSDGRVYKKQLNPWSKTGLYVLQS